MIHWSLLGAVIVSTVLATLILVQAFAARRMPDLQRWHLEPLAVEFTAADLTPEFDLEHYLRREQALFEELSGRMLDPADLEGHSRYSRFVRGGPQDPAAQPRNWNRTVELAPDAPVGGVLLLHGLTDSPYSMRSLAELFFAQGFHVLAMRMPGHGTVPAALLDVSYRDWAAAVAVGARHVQGKIGATQPFYMAGYSNGGALALLHTLDAIQASKPDVRVPDRLFLLSPAVGITAFARAAGLDAMYGFIPYLRKSKWLGIQPEFDPYKYNSFAKNAGRQSWLLANAIQARLHALEGRGRLGELPPILTFQSLVDSTVVAETLMTELYARLQPGSGSEVVFFDINRAADLESFLSLDFARRLDRLMQRTDLPFTVTRLTNRDPHSRAIHAETRSPGAAALVDAPLELEWPRGVFSLAHVSVPFPPDDPLYGAAPPDPPVFGLHIGSLAPRGERQVLEIPASQLIRIRHNPFHAYMTRRIVEAIQADR